MRIASRAERIEPFYVMEVAKTASSLAQQVAGSDRPMIFLNIGEPDFTAPPLVREAAERALATYDASERIAPKRAARPKAPPREARPAKRRAGRA